VPPGIATLATGPAAAAATVRSSSARDPRQQRRRAPRSRLGLEARRERRARPHADLVAPACESPGRRGDHALELRLGERVDRGTVRRVRVATPASSPSSRSRT
jgi:hypothetical protein